MSGDRSPLVAHAPRSIVHLVGRPSDHLLAFVGPVTETLADAGLQQTVILLDDPRRRDLLPQLDARARVVLCRADAAPWRAQAALLQRLCDEVRAAPGAVVHLHGIAACLLGGYAARFRGLQRPLHFSPYGSGGLWRPLHQAAAVLLWLLRPRSGEPARRTITSHWTEVDTLQQLTGQPVDLVEASVDSRYFDVGARREARRPLVVTASRGDDPRGAALFTQLAVLLSEEALNLSFNWIGPADADAAAQLGAAGVGLFDTTDDARRIAHLKPGWLYVASDGGTGFPASLVEAMAMGLPCVAWATPQHCEVLRHGETGLLCSTESELLACIASLVDSASYRRTLGQAAREEALRRFHRDSASASLLASYRASLIDTVALPAPRSVAPARQRRLPATNASEP